jgi:hypothetical protein
VSDRRRPVAAGDGLFGGDRTGAFAEHYACSDLLGARQSQPERTAATAKATKDWLATGKKAPAWRL